MSEKPRLALLIVDVQEDFCPPNGSLPVPDGRAIIPTINDLLSLPFTLKLATKDHHPQNHTSFASNHPGLKPFESFITIVNPNNPSETYESRLWPDHCIQGTPGNALIPELDLPKVDKIVLKGCDPRVEMYSAFKSPLRDPPLLTAVSELSSLLEDHKITDVVVVGLAGDYCVKASAIDSAEGGWKTYVVDEATRCVGGDVAWEESKKEFNERGVNVVNLEWVKKASDELL
ncbi:hypothetical protein NLI96_g7701 [Meripilus lineatus]|uniref:nicotinamidase n=1 Tax=Meripilus lineatus TaxID=2056292 RepID=A0AAD5UYP6_9APHY|nr:hypothetical protein NLI96_g7701 [Physisporinus lineatus]